MYHCQRRNKGILDKQFVAQSMVFRKDVTYPRMLEKCISMVFPDDSSDGGKYYMSNGRGMPICDGEYIRVDNDEGEEELIPWTLETYIKLSNIKYASKARFYCVKDYTAGIKWHCTDARDFKMFPIAGDEATPEDSGVRACQGQQEPLAVGQPEALPVGQQEPLPVGQQEPLPVDQQEPLIVGQQEPLPVGQQEPLIVGQQEPLPVGQQEPLIVGQQEPLPVGQQEPLIVGQQEVLELLHS